MEKLKGTFEALMTMAKEWGIYVIIRPMPGPLQGKVKGIYVHNDDGRPLEELIWLEEALTLEELVPVLAHELGHYQHRLRYGELYSRDSYLYNWAYDRGAVAWLEDAADELGRELLSQVMEVA